MFLLFWPFMLASIVFSLIALSKKKPLFLVISFLLIIPFSLYLAATPLFKWWGLILPFFYLGSALSLRKNIMWLSVLLILPVLLVFGWLGYVVITQ
ncbi:hypothetical protein QTL97_14760 [Sporosarcina thermotolerans]|uniref:Uncharacterized protein n=1 Tax=Sporosarcina thermotolerans TaxID=633404 RepID=A0AAW9AEX5_9BACL|nr:hypothetical protein [Sporosarcina thermotolerans]MDW0118191.1 hypothetical protein [Sporosarcina thermotolerans]WHT47672.1 hypothetical protein QNH10_16305 [Sporosarcina thermotolerans]